VIETFAPWAIALILALVGGGVGWSQVRKHGQNIERLKQAEGERDAAREQNEIAARPPLTGAESVGVLRRVREAYVGRRKLPKADGGRNRRL